jgi:hypothetical protein
LYALRAVREQVILPSSVTRHLTEEVPSVQTPHDQVKPNTIYSRRYRQTEKGKANDARYNQSPKGRATRQHYDQSEAGKASNRRYQQSEKGKEAHNRYTHSEKGRNTTSEGNKRRYHTRKQ